jgi:hypothetical protein
MDQLWRGTFCVRIGVMDRGNGFNHSEFPGATQENARESRYGRGFALINYFACKLEISAKGNDVTAFCLWIG